MKNLTPILSHPAARERVGWMTEQVRADRDRKRHAAAWWVEDDTRTSNGPGNGGACVVACIILGSLIYLALLWRWL